MHIAGRIKVGMALVVARGTIEELASFAGDPLPRHQAEPHPFGSTTGTILRCAMGIDFDAHYPFCIRFFLRELVNFAFELIGLFAIAPPGFATACCFDRAQAFKEQHTPRIPLTDLDNGSRRFVSSIGVLPANMPPELLVASFTLDCLAGLPLLFGNAPQMPKACLIETPIRDKARLGDLSMLSDRDHRKLLDIQIDSDRDQIRITLAFHDLAGFDRLALQEMNSSRPLAQDQFRTFLLPSFFGSTLLKIAVVASGILNPRPCGAGIDLESDKALS